MAFYYFITIDKTLVLTHPTRNDYYGILEELCDRYYLKSIEPYRIQCFEYKQKGSVRKKTKVYDWPHFHAIVRSQFLSKIKPYYKGYSTKVEYLKTPFDIVRVAGYIQKRMMDEVKNPNISHEILHQRMAEEKFQNVFDEYAFED